MKYPLSKFSLLLNGILLGLCGVVNQSAWAESLSSQAEIEVIQPQDTPAVDDESDPDYTDVDAFTRSDEKSVFSVLDTPHRTITDSLKAVASGIDEFFAEERVLYDRSGSVLRFTFDSVYNEYGDVNFKGDVKLKLRIPNTQRKMKLTFESSPEPERDDIDAPLSDTPSEAVRDESFYADICIS